MKRFKNILYILITFITLMPLAARADGGSFVVVLDAGHGGKDPGAVGSSRSNREKDINLKIALEIGRLLKANCADVKVVYTRSTDTFVELGRRAEIANKAKADLFISIHTNALPKGQKQAQGVQSYTLTLKSASSNLEVEKRENSVIQYETDGNRKYSYNNPKSSESDIMYELMQDYDMASSVNFAKIVQKEMVQAGRRNMGVLQANFAVLRLTYMPSVLLEVGYISTPAEEKYLLSASGQATLARSIYNGIVKFKAQQTGRSSKIISAEEKPVADNNNDNEPVSSNNNTTSNNNSKNTNSPSNKKKTVYKVQVMVGTVKLKPNDKQFKGLKCEMHRYGKKYTYTYGNASTLEEAKRIRRSILNKFPQAYIVEF